MKESAALVTGVATWPASDGALELFKMLKPLGDLTQYQFDDWRNRVVSLDQDDCLSAVYSRPGEAYLVLANLNSQRRSVNCVFAPRALKSPIASPTSAEIVTANGVKKLRVDSLTGDGLRLSLAPESALLIRIK